MHHVMEYVYMTQQAVLHYAAISMKPNLKDKVLRAFFPAQTATTMLLTTSALMLQSATQDQSYVNKPHQCTHPSGLRSYGAGKAKVKICDLCGSRWVVEGGNLKRAQPKASPTAKTPLHDPKSQTKSRPASSSQSASWDEDYDYSSQHSWPQAYAAPPQYPTSRLRPTSKPKPKARPLIAGMTEEEVANLHRRYEDLLFQREVQSRAFHEGISEEQAEADMWWGEPETQSVPPDETGSFGFMDEEEEELVEG